VKLEMSCSVTINSANHAEIKEAVSEREAAEQDCKLLLTHEHVYSTNISQRKSTSASCSVFS
jgi:hypothetical protein